MGFSTFGDLKSALANWLNRSDLTDAIPDFIIQAEATLNKVLRTRHMIATTQVTVSSDGRANLPGDLKLIDIAYVSREGDAMETLVKQAPEWLARSQRLRLRNKGIPLYYSIVGSEMIVCPAPTASRTYNVSYYKEIPPLAGGGNNWLLERHPDLYLYTALMHAYPFLADEARSSVMGNQMVQMVQALLKLNETTTLEGAAFDVNKG